MDRGVNSNEKNLSFTKLENCAPGNKILEGHDNHFELSTLGLVLIHFRREGRGKRAKLMRKGCCMC